MKTFSEYELAALDELEALADESITARYRRGDAEIEISMPQTLADKFFAIAPRRQFLQDELRRRYTLIGKFWIDVDLQLVPSRNRASFTVIHSFDHQKEFYGDSA